MVDIRKLREEKKLSQEQLGSIVGITRQAISNIECGVAKPTVENAKKLGKILDFDWTECFEAEDNSNIS